MPRIFFTLEFSVTLMSDEWVLLPTMRIGTSVYPLAILILAGLGAASSLHARWNSALWRTSPSPLCSLCCPGTNSLPKINAVPWQSMENRSLPAVWKHEAVWRYEARKTLTSTTASLSTKLNVDYGSPLVFVMVGFPSNARLDNLDAACLFGLCILSVTMWKGNQKANQNHLYETDSIKKLLAISMVFL